MPYLFTKLSREEAEEHMITLTAVDVPAKLRYLADGDGSTDREYAIFVDPDDLHDARQALGLDIDDSDEALSEAEPDDDADSMFACPRCGLRKIRHPDEPFATIVLLSLPLLMLPAFGWMIWKSTRGSKKECTSCRHTWRSKP